MRVRVRLQLVGHRCWLRSLGQLSANGHPQAFNFLFTQVDLLIVSGEIRLIVVYATVFAADAQEDLGIVIGALAGVVDAVRVTAYRAIVYATWMVAFP